jgi:uncharacterized RDD family membrane protein YckC
MAATSSVSVADHQADKAGRREIITPEGVPLAVDLAGRWERAAAVSIDLIIMAGIIVVLSLVVAMGSVGFSLVGWGLAFVLLISFLVRSFYFIVFELRWQGTTPGKRALGLRVIDRAGGRLRADAIFARNLMREVELFLPLSLLIAADHIGSQAWVLLLTLCWTSIFTLMPIFNKDRLRVGDIVGGTWVINAPKSVLLPDMAEAGTSSAPKHALAPSEYAFTDEQLDAYGIYELQMLENVLRKKGVNARQTRDAVCKRIQRKIGWDQPGPVDSQRFLGAFYAALRAHLEKELLFGVRREDKHDRD